MTIGMSFRRRLQVKVIALIATILILGFGVLVILNIERESQTLIAHHHKTSSLLATAIVESIANGMLEARPDIIRFLIQDLKTSLQDIKHLDVFRLNGVEAFSDLSTFKEVDIVYNLDPTERASTPPYSSTCNSSIGSSRITSRASLKSFAPTTETSTRRLVMV